MFTETTIIIINVACISLMLVLLTVLAAATRMKGGAGWAALILVTSFVPVFLAGLARETASEYFLWFLFPGIFLAILCFPALWFFAKRQLDKSFRFTARNLWHLTPPLILLTFTIVYYAPLTTEQIEAERVAMVAGNLNLPAIINDIMGIGSFFIYFTAIFFYVRKQKKYLQDNYSDSGLSNVRWTVKFLVVSFFAFVIAITIYCIDTRTEVWICPLMTCIAMIYLVYIVIYHSTAPYLNRLPEIAPADVSTLPTMTAEQMKEICDTVTDYLKTAEAYRNSDLTLSTIAHETGIYHKKISIAINTYLNKNFFELVNTLRVEEAKRQLQTLSAEHTIESIAAECGFRSRTTFFVTFKKIEGVSPAQWLKKN